MAFTYKQRKDGGFDFFNQDKKTTIEDYVRNTGANQNNLRTMMAQKGDKQSQRIAGTLPVQFSANNRPGLTIKTPTLNPVATMKPTSTVVEPIVQPIQQRPVTPMAAPVLQKQATLQQVNQPQRLQVARPQTQTNLSVAPTQRNQWEQEKFDRLEPLFKQNKSFEDIAKVGGYSTDEVRKYADANHKNYGDQGIIGNTVNGVGGFVNTMAKNAAGIVTKPVADLTVDKNSVQNELMDINTKFQNGAISEAAAMERANEIANRFTNKSVRVENGWITVKTGNIGEFAGKFVQQGIDTASVLPTAGGISMGTSRALSGVGTGTASQAFAKAGSLLTAGTSAVPSRLSGYLANRGMSQGTSELLGNAITSNAKQSLVYGTAQTGSDLANGRGITPESLALNYGADFVMGALPEIAIGGVGLGARGVKQAILEPAMDYAEKVTGLPKLNVLNDNEAFTLADFASYKVGQYLNNPTSPKAVQAINQLHMQARQAAGRAGLDIVSGSRADINRRIADYLEKRDMFNSTVKTVVNSGYHKIPGRNGDLLPDDDPTAATKPSYIGKVFKRKDGKTNVQLDGKLRTFDEYTDSLGNKKTRMKDAAGDSKSVDGWVSDGSWNIKDGGNGELAWLKQQIAEEPNMGRKQDLARQRYQLEQKLAATPDAPKKAMSIDDPTAALKQEAASKSFGTFKKIDTTKPVDNPVIGQFDKSQAQRGWTGLTIKTSDDLNTLQSMLNRSGHKSKITTKDFGGAHPLSDVIDNPELFAKYPQLKDSTVVFADFHTPKKRGMAINGGKTVFINSKLYEKDPTYLNSTIVHEIQHIKQDIRGMKKHDAFNDSPMTATEKYNSEWEVDARRKQQEYLDWQKAQASQPPTPKVEAPQPTATLKQAMDAQTAQKLYDTYDVSGVPAYVKQMMRDNGATQSDINKLNNQIKQAYAIVEPDKYKLATQPPAPKVEAPQPTVAINQESGLPQHLHDKLKSKGMLDSQKSDYSVTETSPDGYGVKYNSTDDVYADKVNIENNKQKISMLPNESIDEAKQRLVDTQINNGSATLSFDRDAGWYDTTVSTSQGIQKFRTSSKKEAVNRIFGQFYPDTNYKFEANVQPTVAPVQKPKQSSAFEQDLQKAGLGAKKSSYASQSKETKKAIDAHIAKEYPELGHHMTADSQFPNGVPKVRPEDVRRISGMSPSELGIPPRYLSKNALPMDILAVEYETSVRGNADVELKMTDEDYLNIMIDKLEAGRASAKVTQKLRELRNDPNVISKASATLEAEKAYYAPDDGFELSKADSNAYAKMVAKANQEKPGTSVGTKAKAQQPSRVSKTTPIQQPSATLAAKTSKTSQLAKAREQELMSTAQPSLENQVSTSSRSYADNTTSEVKKRGFTQSVENSDEVSGQVRRKVSGEYNVRSTKNLALNADDYVKGDIDVVSKDVNSRLDTPLGKVTDQDIADSIAVAKRLDGMGKFDESQAIYDKLAEHGTRGGQAIQAFSLLQNRTPEGVKFQMLKHLKKAGVELTKADQKTVGGLIDEVRKTKVGTEARDRALFNTLDYVSRKIPTSSSDKLVNLWRAGLLTAPKTTAGNILGNTTELATQKLWANPIAVATDKFFSMFTGKRTKTIGAGTTRGMVEGTAKGFDYLKTGFDPRNAGNMKYDAPRRVNYKNKILDTYVNGVYRWMGAQDQPFYYGAKAAAAHDLAKADGINLGYKGQKLAEYVEASVSDGSWQPQTFKTKKDVTDYAKYAVYQNETMLGSMASGLKQGAGRFKGGRAITDFILPFTQVPSSVAMRIIDRTPIGIIKEAVSQFKKGSFDQRAMAEAIGNGSFGIPVIAAGFALANSGDLTGQYPTDQKEQQLWEAEGKQPYSVKIDGKWYSLNYMQPFGTLMAIGKQVSDDKKDGKSDAEAWLNASGAAAKSVESQSFLQGLNGVLSAVNDPKRSMNQWAKSTASSVVPNFVRSGATAADDKQRETKTPFDAFKGSIPGVRQTLPVKRDMFGKDLEARDDFVNQYANPLKPSKVRNADDATTQELRRLQDAKNGIVTTEFDKKAISGVELNDEQVRNLNQLVNTEVKDQWDKAIQSAGYKDLSDEDKADYLKKIKDGVADHVKEQFVSDNSINTTGEYGNKTIPNGPSNTAEKSYADKYQLAQDDWNKNNASYSPVEKMKKQRDLAMLKVQKDYDNDSVALYGMGEKNIYAFLDQQDEKTSARYYGTLLKYGDALEAAGLGANKLRDKYGNAQYKKGYSVASSKGSRRSSTRRSGTSKTTIASILAGNKSINDMNNSTYLELNRLLSGVSKKSSQPKTLGRKVALKKISSKGVRS